MPGLLDLYDRNNPNYLSDSNNEGTIAKLQEVNFLKRPFGVSELPSEWFNKQKKVNSTAENSSASNDPDEEDKDENEAFLPSVTYGPAPSPSQEFLKTFSSHPKPFTQSYLLESNYDTKNIGSGVSPIQEHLSSSKGSN